MNTIELLTEDKIQVNIRNKVTLDDLEISALSENLSRLSKEVLLQHLPEQYKEYSLGKVRKLILEKENREKWVELCDKLLKKFP